MLILIANLVVERLRRMVMVKHGIIKNKDGFIVARLYILPNGNLHADSWLCPLGWGSPEHTSQQ